MADHIEQRLRQAGLERYEISNYARPGFHSRHNVNYWTDGDYLGLGAGAHSYQKNRTDGSYGRRWWNEKAPNRYIQAGLWEPATGAGKEKTPINKGTGRIPGFCASATGGH